jgi:hypothetical protein
MQAASLTISVLALLFTVASFWWLWARRGPVVSFPVTAYAAAYANEAFRIRVPVVLANRGAAMRVVVDARLRLEGQHGLSILKWGLTRKTLQPGSDDVEDFPAPQTILGRSAMRIHMEFRGDLIEHLPEPVDYKFTIELLLDDSAVWQAAGAGVLRFGHMVHPDRYITYDNSSEPCSPDEPIEARAALLALARRQNLTLPWQ